METELKKDKEIETQVYQVLPQIHFLPQEQVISHNMQYNYQLDPDRRRQLFPENLPGLYNMSFTKLLASLGAPSSSSSLGHVADIDSWVNSWKMESNPWTLNPGSPLGINTMHIPQYELSTPQKFICDLNLTPEETGITSPGGQRQIQPEFPTITLDTPGKRVHKTERQRHVPINKSLHETSSPEKKRKREKNEDNVQLKTPQPIQKRKKIRPKVVREGDTKKSTPKPSAKKTSPTPTAVATNTDEANNNVRPKRSTRRSLRFDFDDEEEENEYCGLTFTPEGHIGITVGGKIVSDTIMRIFDNVPKRRRQSRTKSKKETLEEKSFMEPEEVPTDYLISENNHKKFGRKRSNTITRPRNFRSLKRVLDGIVEPIKSHRKGYETHLQFMQPNVSKKKRSNRDSIASQLNARVLHLKWRRQNSTALSPEVIILEQRIATEAITKLFEKLDINGDSLCLPQNRETALILHKRGHQEEKEACDSIVPYTNEKKHQPKVDLDDETNRVWKLLMVSIDSEGVDGSDEDKQKWWEDERNVFHGRANSFIARMRLVQGDRSFSPWKGSVVDSVVGVFLTQNVADHSSSSAFMDIAAEFPINLKKGLFLEDRGSSVTQETVPNAVANPRISSPKCIIIHEVDDDEEDTDVVCSQVISKTSENFSETHSGSETYEEVDLKMLKGKGLMLNTDNLNNYQESSMAASTSASGGFNLNEVPAEVENDDAVGDKVVEEKQIQEFKLQEQESNTGTNQNVVEIKKNKKKPARGSPAKRKPKPKPTVDWDSLRRQAEAGGKKREKTDRTMDTVDWDALRCTNVNKIADIIRKRGMNNMLSTRIKAFLNRLVKDHGEIDLEWLRDVPPDKAKEYLLSINGLGLKSVECVRLLSLHQIAFPVDTNVGRIAVRLGWVPLQPLPDELQMHLLELYPVLESVQKYLWPRLCKLDQKTLYELHYHMITFGKVFCTKVKPKCNACPMKAECRHYASARASARLALPEAEEEAEEETAVIVHEKRSNSKPVVLKFSPSLLVTQGGDQEAEKYQNSEPIIEEPASPGPECALRDIEDYPWDNNELSMIFEGGTSKDPWENDEIPTIMLHKEAGTSTDMVVLNTQAASMPTRKLKIKEKLRTEHYVYELPDTHPILEGFEKREEDDAFPYLLAIWTPGETSSSIQPPETRCVAQESNTLCHEKTCFSCNNIREHNSQIVRGTVLIPCRTAMRGGFPLNGTYFQTNEVFADHGSSINPIDVPREWLWNLPRRITYFGSSVSSCFGGLTVEAIQYGFWRGYVCVRGFDREKRRPKTLVKRLHCQPSQKKQEDNE